MYPESALVVRGVFFKVIVFSTKGEISSLCTMVASVMRMTVTDWSPTANR